MEEMLEVLLDGVTEPRLKLIGGDEARALMILLGVLDDQARSDEVRRAAGELRMRLASRLAEPAGLPGGLTDVAPRAGTVLG
ncbi:hypothetical protein ABZY44_15165 [Streptomyces sp. NPDC006544]|uniref:hypothetical protein n=1 Tax=Streptomyces sp. NPDC006544 TaxID=3154583 RepID=UPI0033AB79E5